MHLRAIKLRGFKSFPDPVEVRLEPGVAVVVGPNGSGKSNIADGLVWAAGSLAPSELRAEKPDDELFAGGGGRPAEDFCEVELLFDNPDGDGPLPYSELSVARRLHRGGEGQYLLNRTPVRRVDLVELLADLGLGGGMHSIIGQGRVEEILGSKPEERRELLEEAAGLGRFKKRKHRAELKLGRVAVQVERARDVEAEVKKRLRPLALQATAAGRREQATATLYRLRSARERLELRRESAQSLLDGLRAELARPRRVLDARVRAERESLREQARVARERLHTLERALAEREGLPPAARALAEEGERLALSLLEVEPGTERAVAAALGHRAAALVADDARAALALAERARAAGLGSVVVLTREPGAVVRELPVVPKEQLLHSSVPAVTPEGFGYDPERGELWFAGETAEAVWLELEARRRALAMEVEELEARAVEPAPNHAYTVEADPLVRRLVDLAERLAGALTSGADRFEGPLRARADAGASRIGELAVELRRLGAAEVDLRRASAQAAERLNALDVERARLEAEADEARRRLSEAGSEPAEGVDRAELAERIERLERRRETLGQVNPLAREEYEREKERLI